MSRRRPRPEPLPGPAYSRNQAVKITCTDRGQHPPEVLHHLTDVRHHPGETAVMWPDAMPSGAPLRRASPLASWSGEDGSRTYRFRCPACPRDVRLREDRLFAALDSAAGQRVGDAHPVLDISLLG